MTEKLCVGGGGGLGRAGASPRPHRLPASVDLSRALQGPYQVVLQRGALWPREDETFVLFGVFFP